MKRFRPVVLTFDTKVRNDQGDWEDATISTAGYEDTQHEQNPNYFVLCDRKLDTKAILILKKCLTAVTYFD